MVTHNPEPTGRPEKFNGYNGTGRKVKKDVRALRQQVVDLKRIMVGSLKPEELFRLCRDAIDLALAGNKDAREWIIEQVVGTPIKSPELDACDADAEAAPPKVVLLDWRRNGLDAIAESN
jgi:hypothetical protein